MNVRRYLPGIVLAPTLAGLLAGCASIGAPLPPSLELPKPPTDLRAVRKGDRVYLFWTLSERTTDRQNLRHPGPIRVCRSLAAVMSECDTPVGSVAPGVGIVPTSPESKTAGRDRLEASFVDTLPKDLEQQNSTRTATYAVEAFNLHARSAGLSNQVRVPLAPTLPPPANIAAEPAADGVVLRWECAPFPPEPPGIHFIYRIDRRSLDTGTDVKLAEVDCPGRFEDHTIEWEKWYEYRVAVVTSTDLDSAGRPCGARDGMGGNSARAEGSACVTVTSIEGDDSIPQKVFTKDVYPPAVPTGLQAVYSGAGQAPFVDLLWAPDTDADLAGYNVYRRQDMGPPARINPELVKTPAYRDRNVVAGKTYRYSVSAVDVRANESMRSEETSESIPTTP
jgi:hypothetical protein